MCENVWIKQKQILQLRKSQAQHKAHTTMHPIASVLSKLNESDFDNIQFLARIIPQSSLPEYHRFYRSGSNKCMIHYYPNSMCEDLRDCFDFYETCKIPSNCFHTNYIYGEYLPQNILDRQKDFEKDYPIRSKGRYIIVTYVLKRKNCGENKRKDRREEYENNKRFRGGESKFSDAED